MVSRLSNDAAATSPRLDRPLSIYWQRRQRCCLWYAALFGAATVNLSTGITFVASASRPTTAPSIAAILAGLSNSEEAETSRPMHPTCTGWPSARA